MKCECESLFTKVYTHIVNARIVNIYEAKFMANQTFSVWFENNWIEKRYFNWIISLSVHVMLIFQFACDFNVRTAVLSQKYEKYLFSTIETDNFAILWLFQLHLVIIISLRLNFVSNERLDFNDSKHCLHSSCVK